MTVSAIVGMQWGDEGKGKIVDCIGRDADIVVRCQGGSNAGHTVVIGKDIFKLHLIPSGILRDTVTSVVGNGVVLDPVKVCGEIRGLHERGIETQGRLLISERAHLVLPFHNVLDGLREKARGSGSIGTTGQGIGPCYADKAARTGLRAHMLLDEDTLRTRLEERIVQANDMIRFLGGESLLPGELLDKVLPAAAMLRPYIADTVTYLHEARESGKRILLEGAQGAMLDIDFGTYPYLTSSNTTTGGCMTGSGLPPTALDEAHGVLKAFTTRVGAGPFPTEIEGADAERLRGTGQNQWDEFGTTTGRPRRCGWLDLVVSRYSARVNGITKLHITKLDVLSAFKTLQVCTAYDLDGTRIHTYPADLDTLGRCKPVYESVPGWNCDIAACKTLADLPEPLRQYLSRIETHTGAAIASVSFGPGRDQTIFV